MISHDNDRTCRRNILVFLWEADKDITDCLLIACMEY